VRKNLPALLALAALVGAGALVAWWMRPEAPPVALPAKPPVDDLEMLTALFDGGAPREPAHDLLVAGAEELYLARANDGTIVAVPKTGAGIPRKVAQLPGVARGMALAEGALWVSTTRDTAADGGHVAAGGAVLRVPLAGGAPSVVADGLASPHAIASDGRAVFVVDVDAREPGLLRSSVIERIPASGGKPAAIGRCEGEVTALALDDASVYWADPFDGTIVAAPKAGGDRRSLAVERGLPEELTLHGGALYWVERRSETVWTMPAAGGTPRPIVQDFAGFANLVVDDRGVWWVSEAPLAGRFRVLTIAAAGSESSPASEAVEAIDALASDGAHLFWARGGEVSRVPALPADRRKEHAREDE
jgi:hypothetical protein